MDLKTVHENIKGGGELQESFDHQVFYRLQVEPNHLRQNI